ncbi:hypothetical protein EDEG_02855 [Edhazardia aedis USNM 41457]|uniref:HSF-type DNA-binding domain-containing protein n=1 Tax=Edhazardia aedis (strain USNM 41457) TaxID=1003232 RepID=J9D4L4_EDHAE|nr:hypothetical protein EDEG_02855 [Edhazardia aedis USNM 41457]|eukprot:EJW02746.1 hypothetical protein EDEG_02855 [Edhazardia aedis USNM 41457]
MAQDLMAATKDTMENLALQKGKIQKFIKRLYNATNDDSISEITWSNDGKTVFIPNKEKFKANAMGHISKAKEYTAFIRSLHHYGFFKLKRAEDESDEYYHKLFYKGCEDQLASIKRVNERGRSLIGDVKALKEEIAYLYRELTTQQQLIYDLTNELLNSQNHLKDIKLTTQSIVEFLSHIFSLGFTSGKNHLALENNLTKMRAGLNIKEPILGQTKEINSLKNEPNNLFGHYNIFNSKRQKLNDEADRKIEFSGISPAPLRKIPAISHLKRNLDGSLLKLQKKSSLEKNELNSSKKSVDENKPPKHFSMPSFDFNNDQNDKKHDDEDPPYMLF